MFESNKCHRFPFPTHIFLIKRSLRSLCIYILFFFQQPLQSCYLKALSCLLVRTQVSKIIRFPLSYLLSSCPQYNANHRDLNAKAAWQLGYTGKGVVVSILDDGIERNHPDLSQNYVSTTPMCAGTLCFSHRGALLLQQ